MAKGFNKLVAVLLRAFIIAAAVTACTKDPLPSAERYTGDSYGDFHSPLVKDEMSREIRPGLSYPYGGTEAFI